MKKYLFSGMLLIFIGFSDPARSHEGHTHPSVHQTKKSEGQAGPSSPISAAAKDGANVNTLQINQIVSAESNGKPSDGEGQKHPHFKNHLKNRTGFFAVDFINEFNLTLSKLFQYHDTSIDMKFGGQLIPQHTAELGVRLSSLVVASAVLLKYSYDFISEHWNYIPGVSGMVLLGVNPPGSGPRYLTYGGNAEVFLRKFVSKNVSGVLRLGISHELISVVRPDFSDFDVNVYVSLGVRWYLR